MVSWTSEPVASLAELARRAPFRGGRNASRRVSVLHGNADPPHRKLFRCPGTASKRPSFAERLRSCGQAGPGGDRQHPRRFPARSGRQRFARPRQSREHRQRNPAAARNGASQGNLAPCTHASAGSLALLVGSTRLDGASRVHADHGSFDANVCRAVFGCALRREPGHPLPADFDRDALTGRGTCGQSCYARNLLSYLNGRMADSSDAMAARSKTSASRRFRRVKSPPLSHDERGAPCAGARRSEVGLLSSRRDNVEAAQR